MKYHVITNKVYQANLQGHIITLNPHKKFNGTIIHNGLMHQTKPIDNPLHELLLNEAKQTLIEPTALLLSYLRISGTYHQLPMLGRLYISITDTQIVFESQITPDILKIPLSEFTTLKDHICTI
jgi:hypothetical protein